ncbi:unnamed protein product [Brassica rapa]|uniref:Uncharacterized protein n=1 Tax=Brassica campestris TaxID=3711 RepID=A0A3P6A453_BRACM|nr:unnamed protein product [Brassica rapa]VDC81993.1 unnamed protein product [Brassica rapa]
MDSAKEILSLIPLNSKDETSISSLSALSTRVDENKPLNSRNVVESDEKQVTTPDPRWPYLNRWSSNLGIDVSTQAASELAPPHPPVATTGEGHSCAAPLEAGSGSELVSPHPPDVPTVEVGSNASLTENAEEVTTESTILATPAISDKEKAELCSAGSPSLPPELNDVVEKPPDRAIDPAIEQEKMEQEPVFIKSLGAWAKPLHFSTSPTPPEPAIPKLGISEDVKSQIASFWPSIGEATKSGHKHMKGKMIFPEKNISNLPVEKIPPPVLKDDGSLRFPWAARMNQSARNLFRAAEPTYRLDGTPQVTIPSKVLRLGSENKE